MVEHSTREQRARSLTAPEGGRTRWRTARPPAVRADSSRTCRCARCCRGAAPGVGARPRACAPHGGCAPYHAQGPDRALLPEDRARAGVAPDLEARASAHRRSCRSTQPGVRDMTRACPTRAPPGARPAAFPSRSGDPRLPVGGDPRAVPRGLAPPELPLVRDRGPRQLARPRLRDDRPRPVDRSPTANRLIPRRLFADAGGLPGELFQGAGGHRPAPGCPRRARRGRRAIRARGGTARDRLSPLRSGRDRSGRRSGR